MLRFSLRSVSVLMDVTIWQVGAADICGPYTIEHLHAYVYSDCYSKDSPEVPCEAVLLDWVLAVFHF